MFVQTDRQTDTYILKCLNWQIENLPGTHTTSTINITVAP